VSEPNASDATARSSSLVRASAIMALGTIVSRVTGFVRSLVVVWALGTALFADTFNLANTLPNSLYILIAGGALNAVFVPQLVRAMKDDPDGGEAFAGRLVTLTALLLAAASAVAVLAAPLIVRLYASGELLEPAHRPYFDLATTFAALCLPQIFFYGLYVLLGQILNARGRFGPMMWAPILNNLVAIAVFGCFIWISDADSPQTITQGEIFLLGFGSTAGIALQALCLVPVVRRAGVRLRPRFDFRGGGIGKSGRLAAWTICFVLVNQLWFLISTRLMTGVGAEALQLYGTEQGYGLTPYVNSFLIVMLPHSVITVSIVAALLPRMSLAAAEGDPARVRSDLSEGLRLTAVAIIPAAAAFITLGPYLTVALFMHGQVQLESARFMGFVLIGLAVGLVAFSSQHIMLRGFYAYEDTRTPVFIQLALVATCIAGAVTAYLVLPVHLKTVGIGVSWSLGYWLGFGVSLAVLRRRLGGIDGRRLVSTYARAGAAALTAGAAATGVAHLVESSVGTSAVGAAAALGAGGLVLLAGYLGLARLLRVSELDILLRLPFRRSSATKTSSP